MTRLALGAKWVGRTANGLAVLADPAPRWVAVTVSAAWSRPGLSIEARATAPTPAVDRWRNCRRVWALTCASCWGVRLFMRTSMARVRLFLRLSANTAGDGG